MAATRIVLAALGLAAVAGGVAHAQGGTGPPGSQPPPTPTAPKLVVGTPTPGTNVREGQDGRFTLGGKWYFRLDDARVGENERFYEQEDLTFWTPLRKGLPHNWNGQDYAENRSSWGWYRNEFRLPRKLCLAPLTREEREEARRKRTKKKDKRPRPCERHVWRVRFLGANHFARVWLNGRKLGSHNGGYHPFELTLSGLHEGRNTLVVRVSTLRGRADLTHWRAALFNGYGTGGWWNFGGLQREVWLRKIDDVDVEAVRVLPRLPRLKGPARVETVMRVRSWAEERRRVQLSLVLRDGKRRETIDAGQRVLEPGAFREVSTSFTIDKPRLWQPRKAALYGLIAVAQSEPATGKRQRPRTAAERAAARAERTRSVYRAAFGVRQIKKRPNGVVLFNGKRMQARGASLHEDDPVVGSAWRASHRKDALRKLKRLGATITRAHYPLHPAMVEMLDRAGILLWSQAPVYQLPNVLLDLPGVRASSVEANRRTVEANFNNPSIVAWSIANELAAEPSEQGAIGPGYAAFVDETVRLIRGLDDTRLVAIDRHSRIGEAAPCPALSALDAIGVNEYFGWYHAALPGQPSSTTADLLPFLDGIHQSCPQTALFITEYGAESNRTGSAEEKGTYEFQTKWLAEHLFFHSQRSFVNASMIWALKDFRVHPAWGGGNPAPSPPWNNKGLIHELGTGKPAFGALSRVFRRTEQFR